MESLPRESGSSDGKNRGIPSISHTAKSSFMLCQRKYWLRYMHRLEPMHTSKPLRMGSAFSKGLEMNSPDGSEDWYKSYWESHPGDRFSQRIECRIVCIMVDAYLNHYRDTNLQREVELEGYEFDGIPMPGRIDGVLASGKLVEDKFKGRWTDTDAAALKQDDQLLGYVWDRMMTLGCRAEDVPIEYRVTRKPGLRRKKDETEAAFLLRIEQDVRDRPDHYFITEFVSFTDAQVDDWFYDQRAVSVQMHVVKAGGKWPKNRTACKQFNSLCEFFPICSAKDSNETGAALTHFKERENR